MNWGTMLWNLIRESFIHFFSSLSYTLADLWVVVVLLDLEHHDYVDGWTSVGIFLLWIWWLSPLIQQKLEGDF